jgi:hypothetical protein
VAELVYAHDLKSCSSRNVGSTPTSGTNKHMDKKPTVKRMILDSYIAVIRNSVGTNMFRNFYAIVEGKKADIMRDGGLSSALYVSSVLTIFKFINGVHGTIDSTILDLEKSGWKEIEETKVGSVIVWESAPANRHGIHKDQRHIGFYVGNNEAISNNADERKPLKHHFLFGGKRKIERIFWNPKFDPDYIRPGRTAEFKKEVSTKRD